ncbi:MAG: esterase/lipase family protein [Cellulomonas sp.]
MASSRRPRGTRVRHAVWWLRDYAFVISWQARGLLTRAGAEQFSATGVATSPAVVLLPGVYESWQFMRPLALALSRHGYPVHFVPTLGFNTGAVPDMANLVAATLERRGLDAVVLVAHSKGGLIGKYAMANCDPGHRIRGLVAINTPFAGSPYARWIPLAPVRAFVPTDAILAALAVEDAVNARITSVATRFDPHIPNGSELAGATNIELATPGHFRALGDPHLVPVILAVLDRAGDR